MNTDFDSEIMDRGNATTIGNLAYIYLHSPWIDFRRTALDYLWAFRDHFS